MFEEIKHSRGLLKKLLIKFSADIIYIGLNIRERLGIAREENEEAEAGLDEVRDEASEILDQLKNEIESLQRDIEEIDDLRERLDEVDDILNVVENTGEGVGNWGEHQDAMNELRAIHREADDLSNKLSQDRNEFRRIEDLVNDLSSKYEKLSGNIKNESEDIMNLVRIHRRQE